MKNVLFAILLLTPILSLADTTHLYWDNYVNTAEHFNNPDSSYQFNNPTTHIIPILPTVKDKKQEIQK